MSNEYTVNKGRVRSPFKAGTKLDVIIKLPLGMNYSLGGELKRLDDDRAEILGAIAGPGQIDDWSIEDAAGDILEYREHVEVESTNEEGDA